MIRKAIVPMAGLGTRLYPISVVLPKGLMPFALPDGTLTTGLQCITDSLLAAGVNQIAVVVSPENRPVYEAFLEGGGARYAPARAKYPTMQATYESLQCIRAHLQLIEQPALWGLGHAVWCAREFACGDSVLVLLGDHILLPLECPTGIAEVVQICDRFQSPVYGVHRVPLHKVAQYGILQGTPAGAPRVYRLKRLCEKPTPEYAQQHLHTEGLGSDEFLAHSGIYAFSPVLWEVLEQHVTCYTPAEGEWTLTEMQQRLLERTPAYLIEMTHRGLDFGTAEEYRRAFGYLAGFGDV